MIKVNENAMEAIIGGAYCPTRKDRNAGCAAAGIAAGIAFGFNPFVGGLTTLGCMLVTSYCD
jgi:hypothetical protein